MTKLLYAHLDEAQELGASVFIFGDLMDLMQGSGTHVAMQT